MSEESTGTIEDRAKRLAALGERPCVAFAAACTARGLAEAERLAPQALSAYPAMRVGLDLLWRHAARGGLDANRDAAPVLREITPLIPNSSDETRRDPTLEFTARALSLGIAVIINPADAGRMAAFSGRQIATLMGTVYSPWKEMYDAEDRWQEQALRQLEIRRDAALDPALFANIVDYERGAVSDEYLDILESP